MGETLGKELVNSRSPIRLFVLFLAVLLLAGSVWYGAKSVDDGRNRSSTLSTHSALIGLEADESPDLENPKSGDEVVATVADRELVGSIYDYDLDYQQTAQTAADDYVSNIPAELIVRSRPVRVDMKVLIEGDINDLDAIADRLVVKPFQDTAFEVVRTNYAVYDDIDQAIWEGVLVGANVGRAEISIVDEAASRSLIMRIFVDDYDPPTIYSVSPTLDPTVYVAIEANPHARIEGM